ncbi:hypothetical protein [Variovorax sp. RA8]|uniref:hypothetical protein n=1 Tax=Variovorax sp. (strain JCM 16519 / RA8) TaxID=662548 RepID=UPI000B1BD537|nr:hypothetical protein [Variovorax sp. RA8]VTU14380.1 hypothetical protein RA8CHR_00562 [Variovorax sp. RA8]
MKRYLFEALRRVDGGDQRRKGVVCIGGLHVYLHWLQADGTACFEGSNGRDIVGIPDQEVEFDENGAAKVVDNQGEEHQLRILVRVPRDWPIPIGPEGLVPFNANLLMADLILPCEQDAK